MRIVYRVLPPEQIESRVPLPVCARCGARVEEGEIVRSFTHHRYQLIVRCHGETEEVWIDERELMTMTGELQLRPAFAKELSP